MTNKHRSSYKSIHLAHVKDPFVHKTVLYKIHAQCFNSLFLNKTEDKVLGLLIFSNCHDSLQVYPG